MNNRIIRAVTMKNYKHPLLIVIAVRIGK